MPKRPALRWIAIVVATVNLVVSIAASVLEAGTVAKQSAASAAVQPGSTPGTPSHDPGTCPACQVLTTHARRPESVALAVPVQAMEAVAPRAASDFSTGATRTGFASRAPPAPI